MLSTGWTFVIFSTLLLCGGLAYTILAFQSAKPLPLETRRKPAESRVGLRRHQR